MFLPGVLEAVIWAWTYLAVGVFENFEPALYFSLVTFTTLGFGDVVLDPSWRVLSAIEAANGTIMFGWTTALIFWFVQRITVRDLPELSPESRTAEPTPT
jgi:voltage-gated potassium channel Kch